MVERTLNERRLVVVLRLNAALLLCAFFAVVMPTSWMIACHAWIGLGSLLVTPLFQYLTRSLSLVYGLIGVATWLLSGDPRRYRQLIQFWAIACVIMAIVLGLLVTFAGMPWWWAAVETVYLLGMGLWTFALLKRTAVEPG